MLVKNDLPKLIDRRGLYLSHWGLDLGDLKPRYDAWQEKKIGET